MNKSTLIYMAAPVVAWLIAQVIKVIIETHKTGKKSLSTFFKSGNMPSSHTAVTIALLTVLAVREGIGSPVFGVASIFTAIVLYDAINVRRAVGEQGNVLKKVLKVVGLKVNFYIAYGHRITDVCVGAVIGVLCASLMLQIL